MSNKIKIKDLVQAFAERRGETESSAKKFVSDFSGILSDYLSQGDTVNIPGLGSFKVVTRAARKGFNPSTGEPINIPEKKVVKFIASSILKNKVN